MLMPMWRAMNSPAFSNSLRGLADCINIKTGLAGALQFSRLTQGDPTGAPDLALDVIAAVVIGGASLNGGSGSVFGAVLGALMMTVLRNGATAMAWEDWTQRVIIGAVIVAAVALDRLRRHEA